MSRALVSLALLLYSATWCLTIYRLLSSYAVYWRRVRSLCVLQATYGSTWLVPKKVPGFVFLSDDHALQISSIRFLESLMLDVVAAFTVSQRRSYLVINAIRFLRKKSYSSGPHELSRNPACLASVLDESHTDKMSASKIAVNAACWLRTSWIFFLSICSSLKTRRPCHALSHPAVRSLLQLLPRVSWDQTTSSPATSSMLYLLLHGILSPCLYSYMVDLQDFWGNRPQRGLVLCSGGVRHCAWRAMRRTCGCSDSKLESALNVRV